jgi:drug/metabolite transporter (DMT)-like permease
MKKDIRYRILVALAFIAIYFVWGTTYLANTIALRGFPPFLLAVFRYAAAGLLLAAYAVFTGIKWPTLHEIRTLSISGVLMLVGGSGIVVFAQQYIGSGYAAAIVATEPLWFILFDRKRWQLYFSNPWILTGLALGFAGIVWFSFLSTSSNDPVNGNEHWIGTGLLLLASVLWVVGTLYGNKSFNSGTSNITGSSIQLFAAAIVSLLIAILWGESSRLKLNAIPTEGWIGLAYLVIMGSLVAFLAFNWLIKVQPPAIVSTHTFINPIVAIFMGWAILNEQVQFLQIVAFLIVMIGVVIIQLKKPTQELH